MGISTVQIVLLVIFGCIAGMGSVLDSFLPDTSSTDRMYSCWIDLRRCKNRYLTWRYTGNDRSWMDEHRSSTVS